MATYDRGNPEDDVTLAGCNIVGADALSRPAATAARELQKVKQLGKLDPSFEMSRHTMVIHGRPVQVIFCDGDPLIQPSSQPSNNRALRRWHRSPIHEPNYPPILRPIHPPIHPSMCPFIHPSIHPSIHLSIHSFIHPCIEPCADATIHTPILPSTHPTIHPPSLQAMAPFKNDFHE